jgi:hypothetical protein
MLEQMVWGQIGAAIVGLILLVDATLKIASLKYYCFLYEKPFLHKKPEAQMRQPRPERDAQRYAVTIREIGLGTFLIVLGIVPEIGEVQGAALVIGGSFVLYGAALLFISWRNRKSR